MGKRMTCPGCETETSSVLLAYEEGRACPYCGLSNDAMAEISRIQQTRASEELKTQLSAAIKERDKTQREAERLRCKLDRVREALDREPSQW